MACLRRCAARKICGIAPAPRRAAQAIAQGYIYWELHGASGDPAVYTTVYVDHNGGSHGLLDRAVGNELAIAHLEGVTASQLNASLFLV